MIQVDRLMRQAIQHNVFPGGVLLVLKEGQTLFFEAYGYANIFSKRVMTKDTIFDLASLTKPLATTLAVIKLIQDSELELDQLLESVIPEFKNTDKGLIKIKHLLGHNSGLPDYRPYYKELCQLSPDERNVALKSFLVNESLICPVGSQMLYSDLGFMILGWLVENVSGKSLDRFVTEQIYKPLCLEHLFFVKNFLCPFPQHENFQKNYSAGRDDLSQQRNFAATEHCPWRDIVLEGAVHDDNAYVTGGIQGHAGLFGTAGDIGSLLSELLATFQGHCSNFVFERDVLNVFFERHENTGRALGFDTPSVRDSSSGRCFSKKSVGHLGFTGTSFWMDLDCSVIVILLTNRVHPSRDNIKIKSFRPELHDVVMKNVASMAE